MNEIELSPGEALNAKYDAIRCRSCGTVWTSHTDECFRHAYRPLLSLNAVTGSVPHCQRCGWPLGPSAKDGCTAGNCSRRPLPALPEEREITDTERLDWMEEHVFWVQNATMTENDTMSLHFTYMDDLLKVKRGLRGKIDALIRKGEGGKGDAEA